jgi:hypothetical protein
VHVDAPVSVAAEEVAAADLEEVVAADLEEVVADEVAAEEAAAVARLPQWRIT